MIRGRREPWDRMPAPAQKQNGGWERKVQTARECVLFASVAASFGVATTGPPP
jgi:hypothetical protein